MLLLRRWLLLVLLVLLLMLLLLLWRDDLPSAPMDHDVRRSLLLPVFVETTCRSDPVESASRSLPLSFYKKNLSATVLL